MLTTLLGYKEEEALDKHRSRQSHNCGHLGLELTDNGSFSKLTEKWKLWLPAKTLTLLHRNTNGELY